MFSECANIFLCFYFLTADHLYNDDLSAAIPSDLKPSVAAVSATTEVDPPCYYNDRTGLLNSAETSTQDSNQNPVSTAAHHS